MPRRRLVPVLFALLAVFAFAGCGGGDGALGTGEASPGTSAAERATVAERLAAAPAPLRANAQDADTLAGEGEAGLKARLAKLRGHRVVVNLWASWCGPCRAEFPYFADAVVEHGDEVAFLGIDFNDDRDSANAFLRENPPGFASVYDPKGEALQSLGGGRIAPSTFFLDRAGKLVHTKLGGYPDGAALEADIGRHALGAP